MKMTDLRAKVAVITGASSGIGKAVSSGLAVKGTTLCLCGRNLQALNAVAEEVRGTAQDVRCYKVDLNLAADITELTRSILSDSEGVDILVHSAGVISSGELENSSVEDLDWHYRINLRAPYLLTQLLLPTLRSRQGQVVFINSSAGLNAGKNISQYAATKQALKALSDSLRNEVNLQGVRVLSVYPGRTATPMQEKVHDMEGKTYQPNRLLQPEDVAAIVIHALELPRTAEITDIMIRPMTKP